MKRHPFIEKLNEKNLCTWYILPWLGLNVESFGRSNFINAYLVTDVMQIAVNVADLNLCLHITDDGSFHGYYCKERKDYLVFNIDESWRTDYRLFIDGKYTKLSQDAKDLIIAVSGLPNYETEDGIHKMDAILMALDRHPALVRQWSEVLNITDERHIPEELLSAPGKESFITLE